MIPSREDVEFIKEDLRATMKASKDLNINTASMVKQMILLKPKEWQSLYWEIFLYLSERESEAESGGNNLKSK
jgi:hypothetical protein